MWIFRRKFLLMDNCTSLPDIPTNNGFHFHDPKDVSIRLLFRLFQFWFYSIPFFRCHSTEFSYECVRNSPISCTVWVYETEICSLQKCKYNNIKKKPSNQWWSNVDCLCFPLNACNKSNAGKSHALKNVPVQQTQYHRCRRATGTNGVELWIMGGRTKCT